MKHQYVWINNLLGKLPSMKLRFSSREECDDEYVIYEGGEEAQQIHPPAMTGPDKKDLELYEKSMYKLKLVSFVSTFFIIA